MSTYKVPITSVITTLKMQPKAEAVLVGSFVLAYKAAIDTEFYVTHSKRVALPRGMYGDSRYFDNNGDPTTGGDVHNLYKSSFNNFEVTGWDDIGFMMNYGLVLEDIDGRQAKYDAAMGIADPTKAIDYNFQEFEIPSEKAYDISSGTSGGSGFATNFRAHDKALVGKYSLKLPVVRWGATATYDTVDIAFIPSEDDKELMGQMATQAAMVKGEYIRATLINESTQIGTQTLNISTAGVVTANDLTGLLATMTRIRQQLKFKRGLPFAPVINASDLTSVSSVAPRYIAVINPLLEDYFKQLPGFKEVRDYAAQTGVLPNEIGTVPSLGIAFVTNDLLFKTMATARTNDAPYITTVAGDVFDKNTVKLTKYNMLVMAKDAYVTTYVAGEDEYKFYINAPGGTHDPIQMIKTMGWKSMFGCKVVRPSWIFNLPISLIYAS